MKRLSRIIGLMVFAVILSGCSLFSVNRKLSMTNEEIQARITELDNGDYVFTPDEKNLKVDQESYAIYYNNLLNVYLHQDLSGKEKEELASVVDGKLVSNVTGSVNFIQIMVPDYEIDELEQLRKKLYETGKVLFANYETRSLQEETAMISGESVENGTWWKNAIDADRAWKYSSLLTDDAVVGIVDSGFDIENDIFQNDGHSKIEMLNDNTPTDHGTSVAGLIAANNGDKSDVRGIFSDANLLCVDYNDEQSKNGGIGTPLMIWLTNRMVERGVRVINHSYGLYLYDKKHYQKSEDVVELSELLNCKPKNITYDQYYKYYRELCSKTTKDYITFMVIWLDCNFDFLMVCAAGNGYNNSTSYEGYDLSVGPVGFFTGVSQEEFDKWVNDSLYGQDKTHLNNITYYRLKEHIIVVAASSSNSNDKAEYELCKWSNYGVLVDIAAPGENICVSSMGNQVEVGPGTSYAAPIVAGSAAYIWALNPTLTGSEIKECLISTGGSAVGITNEDAGREYKMLNLGSAAASAVLGTVHFTVKDKESGDTIEGVKCDFSSDISDDITDDEYFFSLLNTRDDGELFIPGIGTMHITLSKKGYETYSFDIPVSVREDVEVGDIYLKQDKRNLKRVQVYNHSGTEEILVLESEYTFNDQNQLIGEVSGNEYYKESYTYTYDQSGKLLCKFSVIGEPYQHPDDISRSYDNEGRLVQEKGKMFVEGKMSVDYTYGEDGRVASEHWYDDWGDIASYNHKYEVGSDGTVIDRQYNTSDNINGEEIVSIYDLSGRKIQGYDEHDFSEAKFVYKDDPYFDIVFVYKSYDNYTNMDSAYAYLCDEAGGIIEEINIGTNPTFEYDDDGYLKTVWSDYTYILFEYGDSQEDISDSTINTRYGKIEDMPNYFTFNSGAGAWGTEININDDWSFTGTYSDSDAGISLVQLCKFTGRFSEPVKVNDYTYSMNLQELVYDDTGREYDENGTHYILTGPYGLEKGKEFKIYLPGAPFSELPNDFVEWLFYNQDNLTALPNDFYGIYSVEEGSVFYSP